jgi:hypothetical protein
MNDFINKYREFWGDDPRNLLEKYDYHPDLTKKLDLLDPKEFGKELLYEIVLWKLSRFPYVDAELVQELKGIANLEPKEHQKAKEILGKLLRSPGVALPMASTILRFLNPRVFQIIDDRAYRVLLPSKAKYPSKPAKITDGYVNTSIEIYFDYLDEIHRVTSEKLPFQSADRILYQLDIAMGNTIGKKTKHVA